MTLPLELQALVERLDRELNSIEKDATEGLNLVRQTLSLFPENAILTQYFASFSSTLLSTHAKIFMSLRAIAKQSQDLEIASLHFVSLAMTMYI